MAYSESQIEGRNAVMEAFRAGKTVDKLYILDGCNDGPVLSIKREAKKQGSLLRYVDKERLDQLSQTGRHQGVIATVAAYEYAELTDVLAAARESGEPPFLFLLDGIEDPHNLGAIIRTAHQAGAHGVIIPKNRAVGLTATVARTSAGALNYIPVARVTNLSRTMEELKEEGLWFACADMDGQCMYECDLRGPMGLVIGAEGEGVSRLLKEKCDYQVSIPMKGKLDSLNASVAAGVLAYEVLRQRDYSKKA
ncbi:MAG: 23S rRNA (guanosine(2251)-2'-O)-methyltransferase RlmB [Lachnospiraceae bacterium]|nr:23S rRNA (guanosine(2251)-2'-O)-methyltransferase RlmB [Lachnospiraceae bacterium]